MAALHADLVIRKLTCLDPALYDTVINCAKGRHIALTYLATVAGGIASAIASLDERICPIDKERERSRRDRRWHSFLAAMDRAARLAQALDVRLRAAAKLSADLFAAGETVVYEGGLGALHGECVLTGMCTCEDCLDLRYTLTLSPPGSREILTCVNPQSITAAPGVAYAGLEVAGQIETVLAAGIEALPDVIEPDHAVTLVRTMRQLTGRTGDMFAAWSQPLHDRLDRFVTSASTNRPPRHRHIILSTIDGARDDTVAIQSSLYQAIRTLSEISESPHTGKAA